METNIPMFVYTVYSFCDIGWIKEYRGTNRKVALEVKRSCARNFDAEIDVKMYKPELLVEDEDVELNLEYDEYDYEDDYYKDDDYDKFIAKVEDAMKENMFEYVVIGTDCDGAGYGENWEEYRGDDRIKAIEAKRHCDNEHMGGYIHVYVKGRDEYYRQLQEKKDMEEMERFLEAEYEYFDHLAEEHKRESETRKSENKHFDFSAFANKYSKFDIVEYDDLFKALGDGYGDPGCVDIATLPNGWFPAGFCCPVTGNPEDGFYDPDETQIFRKEDYGKTWIPVANMNETDGWFAAYVGQGYLLDM